MSRIEEEKDRRIIEEQAATLDTIHEMLGSGKWTMDFDKTGMMTQVKWSNEFRRMVGYNGVEATRRIRAMSRADAKSIPIIALTANAFDEDVQHSMQAGLNAHLTKPVEPDILFETLEELLSN